VILPKRSSGMPDVPTYAELGKPPIELAAWAGFCGRRACPRKRRWLRQYLQKAVAKPEMMEKFAVLGLEPLSLGTTSFAEFARRSFPRGAGGQGRGAAAGVVDGRRAGSSPSDGAEGAPVDRARRFDPTGADGQEHD